MISGGIEFDYFTSSHLIFETKFEDNPLETFITLFEILTIFFGFHDISNNMAKVGH